MFDGKHVIISAKPLEIDPKNFVAKILVPEIDDFKEKMIAVTVKVMCP